MSLGSAAKGVGEGSRVRKLDKKLVSQITSGRSAFSHIKAMAKWRDRKARWFDEEGYRISESQESK